MNKSSSNLSNIPKDTVILHAVGRGKTSPSISPFVLKLETYLRMAEIPYQVDHKKPFGPSGKTPWITLNGVDMTDSQLIIEHLNEKFSKNLWGNANNEDKALTLAARVMLEEHFFWGMAHWRFIKGSHTLEKLMVASGVRLRLLKLIIPGRIKKALFAQGLGRHEYNNMVHLLEADLRAISSLIGEKQFILGNEPCEADCAIFGMLAQVIWGMPESPYEKLANDELTNIKSYCLRMKEKYWQDWDDCLYNGQKKG